MTSRAWLSLAGIALLLVASVASPVVAIDAEPLDFAACGEEATDRVMEAAAAVDAPRDMLEVVGLWGVDVQPLLLEAIDACSEGRAVDASVRAAEVITTLEGGSSVGRLRLAGLAFFGLVPVAVLGLWRLAGRDGGPPSGADGPPGAPAG